MKRHLRYVAPERTPLGDWKHGGRWNGVDLGERRQVCKAVGAALAKTGVMRMKPLVPMAVVQAVMDIDLMPNKRGELFVSLLGDIGDAIVRDTERLVTEYWKDVPWCDEPWFKGSPYYYLHSTHQPREPQNAGGVAFAESPQKLVADRFTVMKPGRYLSRFFADKLGDGDIKLWAERYAALFAPAEVQFVGGSDKHEWERIYRIGPQSCMKGNEAVRVYAHAKSVLRLAYVKDGDKVVSRCIVRDDVKEYIRVYPSSDGPERTALREGLEAMGYAHGTLRGVLLDAVSYEGCSDAWVCPYLDSGNGSCSDTNVEVVVVDSKSYLKVGHAGMEGQTQDGYVSEADRVDCYHCGDRINDDDIVYIESCDRQVCNSCCEDNYKLAYGRSGDREYYHEDDCIECVSNRKWYVEIYANDNGVYECELTSEWYTEDDMVMTSIGMVHTDEAVELDVEDSDGNSWAVESDTVTTHDGRVIHKDDAVAKTVWFHEDDDIDNEIAPPTAQQRAA
tara:strand:+ start:1099 stop:2613 length:1515 start_codon:yes stop_codon:yes gene_type:complete